jgi:hypothetical protein
VGRAGVGAVVAVAAGDGAATVEPGVGDAAGVGAGGAVAAGELSGVGVGATWGTAVGRSTTATPPPGDSVGPTIDGLGDGPGEPGGGSTGDGLEVGAGTYGSRGAPVWPGPGLATANPSPGTRGAPIPTARATDANTRLRTPSATTSRARWTAVTSLLISFGGLIAGPRPRGQPGW